MKDFLTAWMIADEHQVGFRFMVMVLLEVGLHAGAHGLHDKPVMLAIDSRKALGPENRLLQCDFTHGGFYFRRVLPLLAAEHE